MIDLEIAYTINSFQSPHEHRLLYRHRKRKVNLRILVCRNRIAFKMQHKKATFMTYAVAICIGSRMKNDGDQQS